MKKILLTLALTAISLASFAAKKIDYQAIDATALIEAEDIDAYVFDGFSNPDAKMINERLFPFIERFQKEKPGVPLIFMKTVWREKRRFSEASETKEAAKMAMADSLMKIAVKIYRDVYWLDCTNGRRMESTLMITATIFGPSRCASLSARYSGNTKRENRFYVEMRKFLMRALFLADYNLSHREQVNEELLKGGYRLAFLLNKYFCK